MMREISRTLKGGGGGGGWGVGVIGQVGGERGRGELGGEKRERGEKGLGRAVTEPSYSRAARRSAR